MIDTSNFKDPKKDINEHEDMNLILRKGRKVTIIEGLSTEYDYLKILKFLKKQFNCNGTMSVKGQFIQLSGDHRQEIANFFVEEYISRKENIRVHGAQIIVNQQSTYCIIFGSAGYLLSALSIPRLRQLDKLQRKCKKNQIYDVKDVDELLNKARKNKENNKDGLLKLQLPVLMQGKICSSGWKQEQVYNALDEKISKDTCISKLRVVKNYTFGIDIFQQAEYTQRGEIYLKDFDKNIKRPLVLKSDHFLSDLFRLKEYYHDRNSKNLLNILTKPISMVFDILQIFGLRTLKVGFDEKIFTFSSNIPVYFFAKIFYHRESGQFFIVPQNKLCTSIKKLSSQLQKEIVRLVGGIQVTVAISTMFLGLGLFLIRNKIRKKLLEIYQKKENQKLDRISQKVSEDNKCIICFSNARNLLFYPCKHIGLCSICYLGMRKNYPQPMCPICKTKIRQCVKIEYEQLIKQNNHKQFFQIKKLYLIMNRKQFIAIAAVNLIVFIQFYYFIFYFLPFYSYNNSNYLVYFILLVFEIIITIMVTWTHYVIAMIDPGYENRIFELLDYDDNIDQKSIIDDTEQFQKQKNSLNKYLIISGDSILVENCDRELLRQCRNMTIQQIKQLKSEIYLKNVDKILKCMKCGVIKYPRTHHCSVCKKCVKRFDHHCVWIGNCIGLNNIRQFVQFLFYVAIGSFYQFFDKKLNLKIDNIFKGICACGLMLFVCLGTFFLYHLGNVIDNVTNLEDQIEKFRLNNNFDKGKLQNFQQIFGKNIKNILLPYKII